MTVSDFAQGVKRDVAELKFLIHDLRVEKFINEVIHFRVTLATDLEILGAGDDGGLSDEDIQVLKTKTVALRTEFDEYEDAVRTLRPAEEILALGNCYIQSLHDLCALVLHPMWDGVDRALAGLPDDSRSVRGRNHYRNSIRWLCGVFYRIERFWAEQRDEDVVELFDPAAEISDYTRNVVIGYVSEKSSARVELRIDRLDPAALRGNLFRFRRMYFNLIMNAVEALSHKKVGLIVLSVVAEGTDIVLRVADDGKGMTEEKIEYLTSDRATLDGELHGLGFVFVRQTVADFGGEFTIRSEVGKGTTMTIRLPALPDVPAPETRTSLCAEYNLARPGESSDAGRAAPGIATVTEQLRPASVMTEKYATAGHIVHADYLRSDSDLPGSIFMLGVTPDDRIDMFMHKPYERFWEIGHEDLSPMFFEAAVRGRLEEDDDGVPVLILKAPQSRDEYFGLREIPPHEQSVDLFVRMVHDEYIRVARKLIETGLAGTMNVLVTDLKKVFAGSELLLVPEPFQLDLLAKQPLHAEA